MATAASARCRLNAIGTALLQPVCSAFQTAEAVVAPKTIVLTGANRGIGLEFVRQYAACESDVRVYACCRTPSAATELNALAAASGGLVTVHALDVTSDASVAGLAQMLAGTAIDVLLHNAGVNPPPHTQNFHGKIDYAAWTSTMETNVYGVLRVTQALTPSLLLSKIKKLIYISSRAGSVGSQLLGTATGVNTNRMFIYRSSKAALNMVAKLLDVELADKGVLSLIIHPGHVVTDMGGENAPLTAEQSVRGMVRSIECLEPALDGDANARFIWYDGRSIPW